MADSISPRAQAILDEIERDSATPGLPPEPAAPAPPPMAAPPLRSPLPEAASAVGSTSGLGPLVEAVIDQVEQARARLGALSEAIEDLAGRVGVPVATLVEQLQAAEETPAPPTAEILELPRPAFREVPSSLPPAPLVLAPHPVGTEDPPPEFAPRVPVEAQSDALEALLAHRSTAGLETAPSPSAPVPEHPDATDGSEGDTSWMSQALQLPERPAAPPDGPPGSVPAAVPAPPPHAAPPPPPRRPAAPAPVGGPPPVPAPPAAFEAAPPPLTYSTIGSAPHTVAPAAEPARQAEPPVATGAERVAPLAAPTPHPAEEPPVERPSASEPPPAAIPAPSSSPDKPAFQAPPEYARLVAAEMATSGASRSEVAERLRAAYGIEDPSGVLDTVFGRQDVGGTRPQGA